MYFYNIQIRVTEIGYILEIRQIVQAYESLQRKTRKETSA